MKHVIAAEQFKEREMLDKLCSIAVEIENSLKNNQCETIFKGKVMASLFYEPSTRTRLSFESAMIRLGGEVIGTESASHFSSAIKGESLVDSIRIVSKYADVIVLRHPENGAAKKAAEVSSVPIINAGDGDGEHPTQALLDIYTIKKELGRIDNLTVVMIGDLKYGRTVHSLSYLLSQQDNIKIIFVSPPQIKMPEEDLDYLREKGVEFTETEDLKDAAKGADVLYVTRIQKERFENPEDFEKVKNIYVVNKEILGLIKDDAIIMHPLPRVNEISEEVDDDPRAAYFRQAQNGLYVRMALLKMILSE